MKTAAGGALYHKEPEAPAEDPGGEDQDLAGARHVMHIEIFGEVDPSHRIGDDAQGSGGDHHRHDRQPIQPVGQVHRIGRTHDHDDRKRHEEIAKVDQRVLEDRQRQLVLQGLGVILRGPECGNRGDGKPQQQAARAPGTPAVVCLETLA